MADRGLILVAGGGIGGLVGALALARAGRRVRVLERGDQFATAGAGIQIGPNGVKILQRYGIADFLAQSASEPRALVAYGGDSGARLMEMPLGSAITSRCGAPYWTARRADLLQAIATAVAERPEIEVSFGSEVVDATAASEGRITAVLTNGHTVEGAALIGADGVWSRVRGIVAPHARPRSSGYCAYRAVIPVADAGTLAIDEVGTWMSPHAHVVTYPVHAGASLNIVVVVKAPWTAASWDAPAEHMQIASETLHLAPRLRDVINQAAQWHKWSLPQPLSLRSWSRGAVTLLGDAAHATLPFFAQGAVMAFEDAVVLSSTIAKFGEDYASAFNAYHLARRERVARVQEASVGNGRIFHMAGPLGWARDAVMKFAPPLAMLARFDWLYAYEPPAV